MRCATHHNSSPGTLTLSFEEIVGEGYQVCIYHGRFVFFDADGNQAHQATISRSDRNRLLSEIARQSGVLILQYVGRSVGEYKVGGATRAGGLTLQFRSYSDPSSPYAIFNVDTRRQRNSKAGRKGEPLPEGRFTAGPKSFLASLWRRLQLSELRSPSDWPDHLGKRSELSRLILTGRIQSGERIDKTSICLLDVHYQEVSKAVHRILNPVNPPTPDRCSAVNSPASFTGENPTYHEETQGLQRYPSTGTNNCGKTVKGDATYEDGTSHSRTDRRGGTPMPAAPREVSAPRSSTPQTQTIEEWLAEFSSRRCGTEG